MQLLLSLLLPEQFAITWRGSNGLPSTMDYGTTESILISFVPRTSLGDARIYYASYSPRPPLSRRSAAFLHAAPGCRAFQA
ncbi:hypothetical protein B0J17DRAFT_212020 [Rhizoctonia solani]|nr:hypothetical protein B0J17DRAFT_212020 [Rhizoctonia solani]